MHLRPKSVDCRAGARVRSCVARLPEPQQVENPCEQAIKGAMWDAGLLLLIYWYNLLVYR